MRKNTSTPVHPQLLSPSSLPDRPELGHFSKCVRLISGCRGGGQMTGEVTGREKIEQWETLIDFWQSFHS